MGSNARVTRSIDGIHIVLAAQHISFEQMPY